MAKYRIGRSYNQVNSEEEIVLEASSQEAAEDIAWQWALERVSSWAELVEDDENE